MNIALKTKCRLQHCSIVDLIELRTSFASRTLCIANRNQQLDNANLILNHFCIIHYDVQFSANSTPITMGLCSVLMIDNSKLESNTKFIRLFSVQCNYSWKCASWTLDIDSYILYSLAHAYHVSSVFYRGLHLIVTEFTILEMVRTIRLGCKEISSFSLLNVR